VLRTAATEASKKQISSADSEMMNRQKLAAVGDTVEGRIRIDVVADHTLRVRYAEGDALPENVTPMVVGAPSPPAACRSC